MKLRNLVSAVAALAVVLAFGVAGVSGQMSDKEKRNQIKRQARPHKEIEQVAQRADAYSCECDS